MTTEETPRRIVVIGTSCAGKTTFTRQMARALGLPHVELDALFWEADWQEAPVEVFQERVDRAMDAPAWVIDGNYGRVRDATWRRARTLVWLDYPFHVVFGRALFRTLKRSLTREVLWSGNRESIGKSFFSRKSILLWVIQTHGRRKREYAELLERPEYAHLEVLRFRHPREADAWLDGLAK